MVSAAQPVGEHVDELLRISPELVLVDPELSRRVRPRVPMLFRRRTPPLPVLHLCVDEIAEHRTGETATLPAPVS
jgi:hypothetical protein